MSEMFQALHPAKSSIYLTYKPIRCADLLNTYYIRSCRDETVIACDVAHARKYIFQYSFEVDLV